MPRRRPADTGLGSLRGLEQPGPDLRVAELRLLLGQREPEHFVPARRHPPDAVRAEGHAGIAGHRHREGNDPPAELARPGGGAQLVLDVGRHRRRDREQIPVERAAGAGAHLGDELGAVVVEAADAAVGDGLERGAVVAADDVAEREDLVLGGEAARHRAPVAVGMRVRTGQRQAEPARGERLLQEGGDGVDLVVGRRALHRLLAEHVTPERAVADEKPGVDRDLPVEAVEELAEAVPLPGRSLLERRRSASPRPAPSCAGCRGRPHP